MSRDASQIQLLALDVDGVLTDGSILLDDNGIETKRFNVRDGFGIVLWQKLGFGVAVITGRAGHAVQHRCAELRIAHLIQNASDKSAALDRLCRIVSLSPDRIAFIGDDWPDLPILRRVGYPIAVSDADPHVRQAAAFITPSAGGRGAVREAVQHLIEAKGVMVRALAMYDQAHAPEPTPPT